MPQKRVRGFTPLETSRHRRLPRTRGSLTGFTLIELIITIAILAVLITIVVVALNPAEQLQRSRDTKRVADLDAVKTAINLYLAQATATISLDGGTNTKCRNGTVGSVTKYVSTGGAVATTTPFDLLVATTTQTIGTGSLTGWIPARMDQTPGGTSLASLPLDPSNGTGNSTSSYYAYACSTAKTFELSARLESAYFKSDLNLIGTDGGNSTSTYEAGADLAIINNAE